MMSALKTEAVLEQQNDYSLQPATRMIASSNAAAPTVGDQASMLNLHTSVKAMSAAVAELRTAAAKVSAES